MTPACLRQPDGGSRNRERRATVPPASAASASLEAASGKAEGCPEIKWFRRVQRFKGAAPFTRTLGGGCCLGRAPEVDWLTPALSA